MLRLPARLLDPRVAKRYCVGDAAQAWVAGEHLIVDLYSEDEDGDWENDGEGLLTGIVPVRAELASGDLRALYLAWLNCLQAGELDDGEPEPRIPAGLGALSGGLRSLADFLRIDPELLALAASASSPRAAEVTSADALSRWVRTLPAADKDEALLRVLAGDDAHLRTELLRRFRGKPAVDHASDGRRTAAQLLDAAEARRADRQREEQRRQAAERARRERAAATAREQHLEALAAREEEAWPEADALIDTKRARRSTTPRSHYCVTSKRSANATPMPRCSRSACFSCGSAACASRASSSVWTGPG